MHELLCLKYVGSMNAWMNRKDRNEYLKENERNKHKKKEKEERKNGRKTMQNQINREKGERKIKQI